MKRVEMIRFDLPSWDPAEVTHWECVEDAMAEAERQAGMELNWGDTQIGYEGSDPSKEFGDWKFSFQITGYDEATGEAREIEDEDHRE